MTAWQRTERWVALGSFVASVAAFLGWVGAVYTGPGLLSVLLLLFSVALMAFGVAWVTRPSWLRWWSGLLVFLVAIVPAAYGVVILAGPIPRVAGLFTLVAIALCTLTAVRRYEVPPVGH